MNITENLGDLDLNVTITKEEIGEGILLYIMAHSKYRFLPYKFKEEDSSFTQLPNELTFGLSYIPRGG